MQMRINVKQALNLTSLKLTSGITFVKCSVSAEALVVPKGSYSGKMADIWQFGVTLFALVYGQIPFNDGNIMKLYDKIQHDELQIPAKPEVSPLLKDMLTRMLQKDPQKRITLPEIKVWNKVCWTMFT